MKRIKKSIKRTFMSGTKPCLKCGDLRWKTVEKHRVYECKTCGAVRIFKDEPIPEE